MATPKLSAYDQNANTFLETHGIRFNAVLIGSDCPKYCEDAIKGLDLDKVNTYPRRTHIHGKHYRVTFSKNALTPQQTTLVIDFWNSYADEEFNAWRGSVPEFIIRAFQAQKQDARLFPHCAPWGSERIRDLNRFGREPLPHTKRTPTPYDVLSCIEKYDPDTFDNWCAGCGYDTDSRRAEDTWRGCVEQWRQVERFFTREELALVQEIS